MPTISEKYQKLKVKLNKVQEDILKLQAECTHVNVTQSKGSTTGGFDPNNDSFWIDHTCPDCGKMWTDYIN